VTLLPAVGCVTGALATGSSAINAVDGDTMAGCSGMPVPVASAPTESSSFQQRDPIHADYVYLWADGVVGPRSVRPRASPHGCYPVLLRLWSSLAPREVLVDEPNHRRTISDFGP
jgi:hypothetical protein